ncbi:MAG: carbon starvation CstA family protein, partial [Phenylobacterium sp.]
AILFEALFILTAVDAGTRAGRFMLQDLLGTFIPKFKETASWTANLTATGLCVAAWGYFLHQGVTDPLGGVNTLWPLFGISNQMLAAIALIMATVVIFKMKRHRYAFVTVLPAVWLCICTLTAGFQKLFSPDPAIGFLSHARKYGDALAAGEVLAPAKSMADMNKIVWNDRIDAALCAVFIAVVLSMIWFGIAACLKAYRADGWTAREINPDAIPAE